ERRAGAGGRRRAADPARVAHGPNGTRLPGRTRQRWRGRADLARRQPSGTGGAGPGDAGRGRPGGGPTDPAVVSGPDRRPLRARPGARQGRSPGPGRRRLPDQTVRDGRAAGPGPGGAAAERTVDSLRADRGERRHRSRPPRRHPWRRGSPPDPDRVRPAPGASRRRRQGAHPPPTPGARLGNLRRAEFAAAAGLRQLPAAETGTRPNPPGADRDGAGGGVPAAVGV
ncbi:MAG: DNA-binding response regulator KdpE, partial [uncultured Thermomicrobiales bacterium]